MKTPAKMQEFFVFAKINKYVSCEKNIDNEECMILRCKVDKNVKKAVICDVFLCKTGCL